MPELPDLLYIRDYLQETLPGLRVADVLIKQPVVLRTMLDGEGPATLIGRTFASVDVRGPFLRLRLSGGASIVINLMLAGRVQLQRAEEKPIGHSCFSLFLDDGSRITVSDEQKMAKVYLALDHRTAEIPAYEEQGVDILSSRFTPGLFEELTRKNSRKQVRVFINDHRALSTIGNAYADEILFEARIHPKTLVASLTPDQKRALYDAILSVLHWGIDRVKSAAQPIHVKVRDHVRVRNRRGEPCPRCGTTIRREGVRGYDTFFCPVCQPATRKVFIDWLRKPPGASGTSR
jgi:formamidopyrimidine-DNA glycosylase